MNASEGRGVENGVITTKKRRYDGGTGRERFSVSRFARERTRKRERPKHTREVGEAKGSLREKTHHTSLKQRSVYTSHHSSITRQGKTMEGGEGREHVSERSSVRRDRKRNKGENGV